MRTTIGALLALTGWMLIGGAPVLASGAQLDWRRVIDPDVFPERTAIESIASSRDVFVAVGGDGDGVAAWYSADGGAWRRASAAGDPRGSMMSVVAVPRGFLAAGFRGISDAPTRVGIWHSPDGLTWSVDDPDPDFGTDNVTAVARRAAGIVAVGGAFQANGAIWSATDGSDWIRTPDAPFADAQVHDVVVGGPGFVAVGEDLVARTALIWTSPDGRTWQREAASASFGQSSAMYAVTNHDGALVAVGDRGAPEEQTTYGAVWTSGDGKSWTRVADDATFSPFGALRDIIIDEAGYVAAGFADGSARTWSSQDGLTWTRDPVGDLGDARLLHAMMAGTRSVAVAGDLAGDLVNVETDALWIAVRNAPASFARSLASPVEVSLDPVIVATGIAAAAGVAFLIPFPSAVFNGTIESNYAEIQGWFRRFRRRAGPLAARLDRFWRAPVGIASFVALSALLYGFLDQSFGLDARSLAVFLGVVAGLVVTTLAFAIPSRIYHGRRTGDAGHLRALPATIGVGLACVLITRITGFQPGYLYGLVLGFVFARELARADEGRASAAAAITTLGVALAAWFAILPVRDWEPGLMRTAFETALTMTLVAGLEGVTFGMLPMRFLAGAKVFDWDRRVWAAITAAGTFAFLHILVNPASGYLADSARTPLLTILALLVAFSSASVLLWAYFRFRRRARQVGT